MHYLHRWFRFWEMRILGPYRVVAVAVGALATAIGLGALTRSKWWKHAPLAAATWALLGKVEGDDRDSELLAAVAPELIHRVQQHIGPVVVPAGFVWNSASRARRPDGVYDDVILYEAEPRHFAARFPHLLHDDAPEICVDLWITIDASRNVSADLQGPLTGWLRQRRDHALADAIDAPSADLDAGLRAVADGLRHLLVPPATA